ncbi:hypothetical protein PGB90_004221 [Kerria lacca]
MYWKTTVLLFLHLYYLCVHSFPSEGAENKEEQNVQLKKELSEGRLAFAIELLSCLHHHSNVDENIVMSPINIHTVLAMLHLGSDGTTREDIANVLRLPKDDTKIQAIHEEIGKLIKYLQTVDENAKTKVLMANGLFVQKEFSIKSSYSANIQKYYNGEVINLDFDKNAKEATDIINNWVSTATKGGIPQLYSSPIDSSTKIVLSGALYFGGKWKDSFPKYLTKTEKFYTGVKHIDVQMMNNVKNVPYYNDPSLQFEAIQIPYEGYEYSMAVFLPYKTQTIQNLTHYLKPENVKRVFNESIIEGVDYKIPRMKFSWTNSLVESLSTMGLKEIFAKANLNNMVTANNLRISDVRHAAEIQVDEDGTVATAITALSIMTYSLPIPPLHPKQFFVDRPFMVVINHQPTSSILFVALVHNPTASI